MSPAKKSKKKKPPGGAAGKPAFSEPRVQIFQMFGGCNFQMTSRDMTGLFDGSGETEESEQTDLMPTLMVVQNNAAITGSGPSGTIETRQNLVELFTVPAGGAFTGVATLIGDELFAAVDGPETTTYIPPILQESSGGLYYETPPVTVPVSYIHYGTLGTESMAGKVTLDDRDGIARNNSWTSLAYVDDQLVGMTQGAQIWTGAVSTHKIANAKEVPTPSALLFSNLTATGMTISATATATEDNRIGIRRTHLNKFGPTLPSDTLIFYASEAVADWSASKYVTIASTVPDGYEIEAVELYYLVGDSVDCSFLARVGVQPDGWEGTTKTWSFRWTGTIVDVSSWTHANLAVPIENYTSGVRATKVKAIDGVLYFWAGDPAYRVWIGGAPGNRLSVSTGTGGGFVDCEPGSGTIVRDVQKFKTNQGASIVTILADNENSQKEHRFNLIETNISLSNEQSVKGWAAEKVPGTVGCKSSSGAVVASDGLYTVSRYGLAVTTHAMENNSMLKVEYLSDPIEPVFTSLYGNQLSRSVLLAVNDILYMTFGSADGDLDNVIFCYDTARKAWWTYTLDLDTPILSMIHIDHEDHREGIGIITADKVYLLPTTRDEARSTLPLHEVLIESAEITTMQPLQAMHHLSQMEFNFDYFIGELEVTITMVDQFGREIEVQKLINHDTLKMRLSEYVRIDKVVESYKVTLRGHANMRLTHFISKLYPKPARIGMAWGFDSQQSHTSPGSIQATFNDYNDLKKAIIP